MSENKNDSPVNCSKVNHLMPVNCSANVPKMPAPFACHFDLILKNLIKLFSKTSASELNWDWSGKIEIQLNHSINQFQTNSPGQSGLIAKRRSNRIKNRQLAIGIKRQFANLPI